MTPYLIGTLFLVGFWGILTKPNLIKKLIGLSIANSAIVLLFIYQGSKGGETAPIAEQGGVSRVFVDPVPQALMLTAIVVGVCVMALGLVLAYRLFQRYGTLDMREIERRNRADGS